MAYTLGTTRLLQKEEVMPWVVKALQGQFVAKDFFPLTPTSLDVFKWYRYGQVGGMTPRAGENEEGPLMHLEYGEQTGRTEFFKQRTSISGFADPVSVMSLAQNQINDLSMRLALRLEFERIQAIITNRIVTPARVDQLWTNLSTGGRNWIGGGGAASIRDHLIDAKNRVTQYSKIPPDTLLLGAELGGALQKNVEAKEWDRMGDRAQQAFDTGTINGIEQPAANSDAAARIGRLCGLDVYISNATTLTDPDDEHSLQVPILDHDAYVFKRGDMLGNTVTFRPPTVDSKPYDTFKDMQEWQLKAAFRVVVKRPWIIYTLLNAKA